MTKTYKGWTRVSEEEAIKYDRHFPFWYKKGYSIITDYMDKDLKG